MAANQQVSGRLSSADAWLGPMHRVLVCLDRSSTSESCLPTALALARGLGAHLELVHVLEPASATGAHPPDALTWQLARAEAQEYLEDLAAALALEDVSLGTTVLQGHVAEQILCFADREGADLIVLASHGEKGVSEWNLGSTAQKIIDRSRVSVMVVPATDAAADPVKEARLGRVLVPLDGSPAAESVLPLLQRLAHDRAVQVVLLHAVQVPELLQMGPPSQEDEELGRRLERRNEQVARRYVAQVAARLAREGCGVVEIVEKGDLRSVLPRVAEREHVDLVAITAHGWTGDRCTCSGTTAGHLIRHPTLPVLMFQNLPQPRAEFARVVRHRREAIPAGLNALNSRGEPGALSARADGLLG